jgi:translation initiation factor IF-3
MASIFPNKAAGPNRGRGDRGSLDRRPRRNERIRALEVRVIGPDGDQWGVLDTREAIQRAKGLGLDLIEVAAAVNPPVCRVMDYGKYKYNEGKKTKGQQKSNASRYKEVKFRPSVDVGDYETKVRHGKGFLEDGFKLKLSLMFRGREMAHQELGFQVIQRAVNDLQEFGVLDSPPRIAGRTINASMSPRPNRVKKPAASEENPQPPETGAEENP